MSEPRSGRPGPAGLPDLASWRAAARAWLRARAQPRAGAGDGPVAPGAVAVFENLTFEEERRRLAEAARWQQAKLAAGYAAITWPPEFGGPGLTREHADAFAAEEAQVVVPRAGELFDVTIELIAPTIGEFGTEAQRRELIPGLLAAEVFACQLFSEPGAGSDLAGLSLRAQRDGDHWVLNGQKVWTSGARHAALGELIARSEPGSQRHHGLTAFIVAMDAPGIEIRPIRQMSGGSSFNEVFFTDVTVPDAGRLGEVGQGWQVALTTLGFERAASGASAQSPGGSFRQVAATARARGLDADPVVRQMLGDLYVRSEVQRLYADQAAHPAEGGAPGAEGSVLKLLWAANLMRTSEVISHLLGPRLIADTGEPGTFTWTEHLLGAPGYRIAGGTEEIQRNIIAERVLGLPREPRPQPPSSAAS